MIIGMTGRIAAGKETLTEFLKKKGFIYLKTSEPLIDELQKKGIEITRVNMQNLGDKLREEKGAGVIMKMLINKIDPEKNYIFDSLRNPNEADFLRKNIKNFILIGIDAPQKIRFERIVKRGKERDPKTWEEFLEVDNRDFYDEKNPMGQRVGECIKIADFVLINDGSIDEFRRKIEEIWLKILQRISDNYFGVIIEESLEDKGVLRDVKILKTDIEKVTEKHKTPWIKQWTLHTVEIPIDKASEVAEKISKSLDKEHSWYADFKNKNFHFIIFRDKVFKIDVHSKQQYDKASEYGISLGIPEYQVDFHPEVKEWVR